jgi:hypothetical protein
VAARTAFMTGGLYSLLCDHSILASSVGGGPPPLATAAGADAPPPTTTTPSAAFFEGLRLPAPLAGLFSARVRRNVLAPDAPARARARADNADFLSGALLALELREARGWLAAALPPAQPAAGPRGGRGGRAGGAVPGRAARRRLVPQTPTRAPRSRLRWASPAWLAAAGALVPTRARRGQGAGGGGGDEQAGSGGARPPPASPGAAYAAPLARWHAALPPPRR